MAPQPFTKWPRCLCCPNCQPSGVTPTGCNSTDAELPSRFSVRFATNAENIYDHETTGRFESAEPIVWGDGVDEIDPGVEWIWHGISAWVKKHSRGLGPDLVVTGTTTKTGGVDYAGLTKEGFTDADTSDVANHPNHWEVLNNDIQSLEISITFSAASMVTVRIGLSSTAEDSLIFKATRAMDCESRGAISGQGYVRFDNELEADRDPPASPTKIEIMASRVSGGSVFIRPCGYANSNPQGQDWYLQNVHPLGGLVERQRVEFDLTTNLYICYYRPPANDDYRIEESSGTARMDFDSTEQIDFVLTTKDGSCGGTTTAGPTTLPRDGNSWVGYPCGRFTFFTAICPPWLQSTFDPFEDDPCEGCTLDAYTNTDNNEWAYWGTITIENMIAASGEARGVPGFLDTSKCRKVENLSGFTFDYFSGSYNSIFPASHYKDKSGAGFNLWTPTMTGGAAEVDADNIAEWAEAFERIFPWIYVSWVDHGTSPLLESVTFDGWHGTVQLRILGGAVQTDAAC